MKKSKYQGIHDYLALIVRRKWWILGTFILFAGGASLFAVIIPDAYMSESNIVVQQRDIPSEFVTDLITGNMDDRASIIEKTILSRANLQTILNEFGDRMIDFRGLNDQRKIAKLVQKISIDFVRGIQGSRSPITNIKISYRDRDPELAQLITSRLTRLFIEQDNQTREDQVSGTTKFLEDALETVAEELEQSESKLQEVKRQYRYELPSEREINLRTLERLQEREISNTEALDRYVSMKLSLEQRLSEVPAMIPVEQARRSSGSTRTMDPAVAAYRVKERELKELSARAHETHPEVQRLKAELEELKKDLPEGYIDGAMDTSETGEEESREPEMVPNPAYQNLQVQLNEVNTEIGIREREKERIANEMELYNQRVEKTPAVEAEIASILRDNEDLTRRHEELSEKLNDAKLSERAENQQKGTQFIVLDPAYYPFESVPPKRSVIFLAGLAASLGIGLGVAFVADLSNPAIVTQAELERVLETKVLIEVPRIVTPSDIRKYRYRNAIYATSFVVLTGLYAGFLYFLYLKQHKLVQILSPLIERIQG